MLSCDNLTAAVLKVLRGKGRLKQEEFIMFHAYYILAAHVCNPAGCFFEVLQGQGRLRRDWKSLKIVSSGKITVGRCPGRFWTRLAPGALRRNRLRERVIHVSFVIARGEN